MAQTLILVTILLITQVTELKLLFETQVSQHRFYYVIMTSLITCICIEILIGLVTVYATHKRIQSWAKLPISKESLESLTISYLADEKPVSSGGARKFEIYKPLQHAPQSMMTSLNRPNLPFPNWSAAGPSSTNQKLPTIRESTTTTTIIDDDKNPTTTTTATTTSTTTLTRKPEVFSIKIDDAKEGDEESDEKALTTNIRPKKSSSSCYRLCCCTGNGKLSCETDIMKSWHNFHFYLLYIVMVLNVFITAFGLSGESIRKSTTTSSQ